MTLEEKLLNILTKYYLNAEDNINQADSVAIAELKQWGREMCDKQRQECVKVGYAMDAQYPKELQ